MTDDIGLFRYNTPPAFCDHALDLGEEYYRQAGVSRLHRHDRLDLDLVQAGELVFIKTDALPFFRQALPKLKVPITLVTGVSDISPVDFESMLDDERIISWSGQNLPLWSDKVLQLPCGFTERERDYGNQDTILAAAGGMPWEERPIDILITAMADTAPERRELAIKGAFVSRERLRYPDYLALMGRAKFVVCPRGNGPDTIRLWEALSVGAVPIVRSGILDPLYRRYGAEIVDDWTEVPDVPNRIGSSGRTVREQAVRCFTERSGLFFAHYWREQVMNHHASRME
ncbi:Zn ribbon nucleic-acid-binding protein [Azospirillum agricola]|uniref:hypothetical protein n=1 Tax=Azospirillum agricola TaxID=1720247 RepID=UPI001AEAA47E|nr:hypothetical protein [Azospirillum agricola]MBP2229184.1 Zn ribbon nucleic-acid-binding protein [Azospirillum agricola]